MTSLLLVNNFYPRDISTRFEEKSDGSVTRYGPRTSCQPQIKSLNRAAGLVQTLELPNDQRIKSPSETSVNKVKETENLYNRQAFTYVSSESPKISRTEIFKWSHFDHFGGSRVKDTDLKATGDE